MPNETRRRERGHAFYPPAADAAGIPRVYETEHIPLGDKLLHLHYFTAGCDWWIAEYNPEDGRAFGYACLNGDALNAEWGAIDLTELESVRVGLVIIERDLYWTPAAARDAQLPGWLPAQDDDSPDPETGVAHDSDSSARIEAPAHVYVTAWTGGYEQPSFKGHKTETEALETLEAWKSDADEGDDLRVLRIDVETATLEDHTPGPVSLA